MLPFELTETELRPGCCVIGVKGELDLSVADQLSDALRRVDQYGAVLVDLGDCEFIDSTGIAVFVRASQEMESEGRKLAVFGADDQVLRVLSTTGLSDNGLVFESAEAALAGSKGTDL